MSSSSPANSFLIFSTGTILASLNNFFRAKFRMFSVNKLITNHNLPGSTDAKLPELNVLFAALKSIGMPTLQKTFTIEACGSGQSHGKVKV